MDSSNAEKAPWDRPDGCFGHCDPEGWFVPCRDGGDKMPSKIRGVLAWRQNYARDALTPEVFDRWLASRDAEVEVLREQLAAAEAVIEEVRQISRRYSWSGLRYALENVSNGPLSFGPLLVLAAHDREVAARALKPVRAAEAEWRRTPMDPRTEERDWVKADIHFRSKVLAALRSGLSAAPSLFLAAVKAVAWDEGYGGDLEATTPRTNPYRGDTNA